MDITTKTRGREVGTESPYLSVIPSVLLRLRRFRFCVVVTVFAAIVTRIVVRVARDIHFVQDAAHVLLVGQDHGGDDGFLHLDDLARRRPLRRARRDHSRPRHDRAGAAGGGAVAGRTGSTASGSAAAAAPGAATEIARPAVFSVIEALVADVPVPA